MLVKIKSGTHLYQLRSSVLFVVTFKIFSFFCMKLLTIDVEVL